jgi:hypothetical protein
VEIHSATFAEAKRKNAENARQPSDDERTLNEPDGAAIPLGVDLIDTHRIAGAHANSSLTIFPAQ